MNLFTKEQLSPGFRKQIYRKFIGSPVVKIYASNASGAASIPGLSTKIPQASGHSPPPKKKNKPLIITKGERGSGRDKLGDWD